MSNLYGDGTVYRGERSADGATPTLDVATTLELYRHAFEGMKQKIKELEGTVEEYGEDRILDPNINSLLTLALQALEGSAGLTAKDAQKRVAAIAAIKRHMR